MDDLTNELLGSAAKRLKGNQRRQFQAEVCTKLCSGSPRKASPEKGDSHRIWVGGAIRAELVGRNDWLKLG